jgi:hypothetical protein
MWRRSRQRWNRPFPAEVELPAAFVELTVDGDHAAGDLDSHIDRGFVDFAVREADLLGLGA